jgi:hypothetical protein
VCSGLIIEEFFKRYKDSKIGKKLKMNHAENGDNLLIGISRKSKDKILDEKDVS